MSMAKQIYELQELDLELESCQQQLSCLTAKLGENEELTRARAELTVNQQQLDELRKHLRAAEYEIKDLESKLAAVNDDLYSGRIRNPKELSNLQADMESLKAKKSQLEDRALSLMDRIDESTVKVEALHRKVNELDIKIQQEHAQISTEIDNIRTNITRLQNERDTLLSGISQPMLDLYLNLKLSKKTAVARVTKGTCQGCRITLPVTDLQRARSGKVIQCSSCGRILYLD